MNHASHIDRACIEPGLKVFVRGASARSGTSSIAMCRAPPAHRMLTGAQHKLGKIVPRVAA